MGRLLLGVVLALSSSPARALQRASQEQDAFPATSAEPIAPTKNECAGAPWAPPARAGGTEICQDGKALPKLYLLGAQKCGTSSLARDLRCAGIAAVPSRNGDPKENRFFAAKTRWRGAEVERGLWLHQLPACRSESELARLPPRVVSDMTPNNMRAVLGMQQTYGGFELDLPKNLRLFYGASANELTMVMLVRSPLSRMQSAWYAAKDCNFKCICQADCKAESFQAALKATLEQAKQGVFTPWLWTSMYGRQLERWAAEFEPSQFYVIPYKEYADGNADQICSDLAARLNFPMQCASAGAEVSHQWHNEHPHLTDDVTPELLEEFNEVIQEENMRFVTALSEGRNKGMGLAGFAGQDASGQEVWAWLEERW